MKKKKGADFLTGNAGIKTGRRRKKSQKVSEK